jgi:hypothetical protein
VFSAVFKAQTQIQTLDSHFCVSRLVSASVLMACTKLPCSLVVLYPSFGTSYRSHFRDSVSVLSSMPKKSKTFEDGTGRLSRNVVQNYNSTLCNTAEERTSLALIWSQTFYICGCVISLLHVSRRALHRLCTEPSLLRTILSACLHIRPHTQGPSNAALTSWRHKPPAGPFCAPVTSCKGVCRTDFVFTF